MAHLSNELLIIVGGNIVSAALMLAGGLFVLLQDWKRDINRLFFFLTFSTLLYTVFFVIAAVQTDYASAYFWWFCNIFDVFITIAVVHFIFRVINRQKEWRWFIIATYAVGLVIFAVAWLEPSWFLPQVLPKLYFPYYLDGGPWYAVMLAYFLAAPLVAFGNLVAAYMRSTGIERRRYEYFILMLVVGYAIGVLNFFLVFNVPVNPLWGMFLGFYFIPIAYGIFSDELLDIRLVARRALYYAVSIAAIAAFLTALILLNEFIVRTVPGFEWWTVPLGVAVVTFIIGRLVLREVQKAERLKYEFITIATHKLRTPLTRIRWGIADLVPRLRNDPELLDSVRGIDDAATRLIELTNVLLEATHTGDAGYGYKNQSIDLGALLSDAIARFHTQIASKKLVLSVRADKVPGIRGDAARLSSVLDVLIENAIMYTPALGTLSVSLSQEGDFIRCTVSDSGIGIAPEDKKRIFSTFFRTEAAKTADTEGVGLGLSLAKNIIEREGGRIGVASAGPGKGSTFWFTLPRERT